MRILATTALFIPVLLWSHATAEDDSDPVMMGKKRSEWIQQLKDEYPENRIRAIRFVSQWGTEAKTAIPELVKCLHDSETKVRWKAVETLTKFHAYAEPIIPELLKDLDDQDKDIRHCSLETLRAFGSKAKTAIPTLLQFLGRDDPEYRYAALQILGAMGSDAAETIANIESVLADKDFVVRSQAVSALVKISGDSDRTVKILCECCSDKTNLAEKRMVAALKSALYKLDPDKFPFSTWLTDKDPQKRALAAFWIGEMQFKMKEPTQMLTKAYSDKDPTVRLAAIKSLSRCSSDVAVSALNEAIDDPDENVRSFAVQTLTARRIKYNEHVIERNQFEERKPYGLSEQWQAWWAKEHEKYESKEPAK